jgi:hypothetical protein
MKKALVVPLTDQELPELCRILLDQDREGALSFMNEHLKKPGNTAIAGG